MSSMLASIGVPKKKKLEQKRLTVIQLNVFTPTPTRYASFDYGEIKEEFEMASESDEEDPLIDHDALEIVKRLEKKYDTSNISNKKKSSKKTKKIKYVQEDVMDKGIGYDLEDAFIDDSEAYDEWVPSTMDTAKSGYYVNKGMLEFRQINSDESSGDSSESEAEKRNNRQLQVKKAVSREPVKRKKKAIIEKDGNSASILEPMDSSLANPEKNKVSQRGLVTEVAGMVHQLLSNQFLDARKKMISRPTSKSFSKSSSPSSTTSKLTTAEATTSKLSGQPPNMKTSSSKTQKSPNIVRLSQGGAPPTKKTNMLRLSSQGGVPPTRKLADHINRKFGNAALARVRDLSNTKAMGGHLPSSPKSTAQKNSENNLSGFLPVSYPHPGLISSTITTPPVSSCSSENLSLYRQEQNRDVTILKSDAAEKITRLSGIEEDLPLIDNYSANRPVYG